MGCGELYYKTFRDTIRKPKEPASKKQSGKKKAGDVLKKEKTGFSHHNHKPKNIKRGRSSKEKN